MHIEASEGNSLNSKFVVLCLSSGALRLRGAIAFLNGSAPDAFAHI